MVVSSDRAYRPHDLPPARHKKLARHREGKVPGAAPVLGTHLHLGNAGSSSTLLACWLFGTGVGKLCACRFVPSIQLSGAERRTRVAVKFRCFPPLAQAPVWLKGHTTSSSAGRTKFCALTTAGCVIRAPAPPLSATPRAKPSTRTNHQPHHRRMPRSRLGRTALLLAGQTRSRRQLQK